MMQSGDWMIAMGEFTTIGGQSRSRVARLDYFGKVDPVFHPDANNTVWCGAVRPDASLMVCGDFTSIAGAGRDRIAKLRPDGSLDTTFTASANATVRSLILQPDGKIVLGGDFTTVNGTARNRLARLNADGTLDTGFNPDADATVRPMALQPDGKILVGGNFTKIKGVTRNRLARLNADGTLDTAFNPNADAQVNVLLVLPDGQILTGGAFTSVGGAARAGMARLTSAGVADPAFNPAFTGSVWTFARQTDGRTLVGGGFTSVNGTPRNRLARLLDDGSLDSVFNPGSDGTVNGLMLQADGKIITAAVATSTAIGGQPRKALARLYNNPAPEALVVNNISSVSWSRGGTSAETQETLFDVSTDQGQTWWPLGNGARNATGWALTGTELPPAGLLRARARTASGLYSASSGFVESLLPYNALRAPDDWRIFYFGSAANTGTAADSADPDHDGLVNLTERAFGQDPGDPASAAVPDWHWTPEYGTASFLQPANSAGIHYSAEWSQTLAPDDWHPIPDTGAGEVHTFTFPLNAAARVFVRFRLQSVAP